MLNNRKVIIAICGKSCSGKDTLARQLEQDFNKSSDTDFLGKKAGRMISCTTRPPRENEEEGVDYFFKTQDEFLQLAENHQLLDYTQFRGWHYGHPEAGLKHTVNIGIFDAKGVEQLAKFYRNHCDDNYYIFIYYLDVPLLKRLKRSYKREHKWKLEYARRAFVDWKDFRKWPKEPLQWPQFIKSMFPRWSFYDRVYGHTRRDKTTEQISKMILAELKMCIFGDGVDEFSRV